MKSLHHERSKSLERYEKLRLREYKSGVRYYPLVCKELNFIWRNAYNEVHENLQSKLLEDTIAAFRFLPQVCSGMVAANLLLQAAESALQKEKEKRDLVVSEFRNAVFTHKKQYKPPKSIKVLPELPQDVLVQIFSLLDMHSLLVAGSVCCSWNSAASDNYLWQSQYEVFFGGSKSGAKAHKSISVPDKKDQVDMKAMNWKEDFKQTFIANSLQRSNRRFCGNCKSVVWVSNNMKCPIYHSFTWRTSQPHTEPVSPEQILEYLLGRGVFAYSSSDSESEHDMDSSDSDSDSDSDLEVLG